jgi:hypothetical protein
MMCKIRELERAGNLYGRLKVVRATKYPRENGTIWIVAVLI